VTVTTETIPGAGPGRRAAPGTGRAARGPGGGGPVIGISSYTEQARWGSWDTEAVLLPRRYANSVAKAGGIPLLLPPVDGVEHSLARLDGLILAGGGDIDPGRFGAQPHPATAGLRPARDAAEFALVAEALGTGLPLLGICRGLQVLNVALGGTLHQHLPGLVGHDGHSPVTGGYGMHEVKVAPDSRLAAALGAAAAGEFPVPTHHHQAISRLGEGLVATAWTADGTIEAAELPGPAFVLAVQWHPEAGDDLSLFRALAGAAARSPLGRPGGSCDGHPWGASAPGRSRP
jgi:putative glutamine amidotransferase